MPPIGIAPVLPFLWRWRITRVAIEPQFNAIMVKLFAPQQSSERLPLHSPGIFTQIGSLHHRVKLIRLFYALLKNRIKVFKRCFKRRVGEAYLQRKGFAGRENLLKMSGSFCPFLRRVDAV